MSKFSNFVLARDGIFQTNIPVWHETPQFPLARFDVIGETELKELFGRYVPVKGRSTATYDFGGETYTLELEKDGPVIVVSRDIPGDHRHMKTHGGGYTIHSGDEWLVDTALPLLDVAKGLGVRTESAICLEAGRYMGISVSSPFNSIGKNSGIEVRKTTSILSSLTGELPSKVSSSETVVVCDNTAQASASALGFEVKHTENSAEKLPEFREAFKRLVDQALRDDTLEWYDVLAEIAVSEDRLMDMIVDYLAVPTGLASGTQSAKNLMTRRQKSIARMVEMRTDKRVAPWDGTALGAYQLLSTYDHYETQTRNSGKDAQLAIARFKNAPGTDTAHFRTIATIAKAMPEIEMLETILANA